jgi:hypothetical protein
LDLRKEVKRGWKNYIIKNSSANIIRMIKSSRIKLAEHVEHAVETRNLYEYSTGNGERKTPFDIPNADLKIILNCESAWTSFI